MICPQCQSENSNIVAFCDQCGTQLEAPCPRCGEPNRQGAKFCRRCGQAIGETPVRSSPLNVGTPAPDTYVPKHLAEKILASRHKLEGERKQVTVLFADIRGSTALVEGLDPEEAQKLIDPVLQIMMDAVHKYEGTVNQVAGDGIMALFGAPLAHEDHALRACYAALAMQEEMRRYRQTLGQSEESGLQIGVGMNSGEVVLRSIDIDINIEYTAIGHTTHLAARLQELAGRGMILMTASTLGQVEGFVQVESLGPVQAKGISQPFEAYSLIGTTSARTRFQAGVRRGLTPLVGRNEEINIFNKLVEETVARRGHILAMVGEPGMGKSRLVHEFTRHQLPAGWLVLEGASVSYGKATPYFPLVEMLRRYFQITDGKAREEIQERVVNHILELSNVLQDTIAPILSLLGALPEERYSPISVERNWLSQHQDLIEMVNRFCAMDPQQRRRRTLDALKRILVRESQRQPLLIVFEDLHWIDSETQAFFDGFVESLPMSRILLLVDYRPEYTHGWSDRSFYCHLRVDPLNPASAEELLQHLLGRNKDLAPLMQLLKARTVGNPFFAEESVRSLVEEGVLTGEKGAYRPGLRIDQIRLPSTVQNVVADRIDRLSQEEKRVLQTAAVIGMIVPYALLQAAAETADENLQHHLSCLQTAEFLYESNLFPELEYSFRHAITCEVAYGELLHERRIMLHAKIVSALEQSTGDNLHDHFETLAHHAYHGELWEKAAGYSEQAGRRALAKSANHEAVRFLEMTLVALRKQKETPESLEQSVDIRLLLRNAFFLLGDFDKLYATLREASRIAEQLGDRRRLGRVLNFVATYHALIGQHDQAIAACKRALSLTSEDRDLNIVSHYYLGQSYHFTGQYDDSLNVLDRVLDRVSNERYKFERFGTASILSVMSRMYMAQCWAQLGDFEKGLSIAGQAIQIAQESAHPYSLAYATCGLGLLLLIKGEIDTASRTLEHAMGQCQESEIKVLVPQIASYLGFAHALANRFDEAVPLLENAEEETRRIGRKAGQALRVVLHGLASLLAGRVVDAQALAEKALQLAIETMERGHQAWALFLKAVISARGGKKGRYHVQNEFDQALALAKELRMNPLQAYCHLGLNEFYQLQGDMDQAEKEFRLATHLFGQMGMTTWPIRANGSSGNSSLQRNGT